MRLVFFLVCSAGIWAAWRYLSNRQEPPDYQQGDAVDKVLFHHFNGGDWETGTAWMNHGRRQTVALIRQGLYELLDEQAVDELRPVWQLGYELGIEGKGKSIKAVQKKLDSANLRISRLIDENERLSVLERQFTEINQELRDAKAAEERAVKLYRSARAELDALRERLEELEPEEEPEAPVPVEERNRRIVELRDAGKSWAEIAELFGLSRTGVRKVYDSFCAPPVNQV